MGRPAVVPPAGRGMGWGLPPAAGSVPHIYTKGAIASYQRAGWPVCGGEVG